MIRGLIIFIISALALLVIQKIANALILSFRNKMKPTVGPARRGDMIQDPACGVYVPRTRAVEGRIRGATFYFCSPRCLEKYRMAESKREES